MQFTILAYNTCKVPDVLPAGGIDGNILVVLCKLELAPYLVNRELLLLRKFLNFGSSTIILSSSLYPTMAVSWFRTSWRVTLPTICSFFRGKSNSFFKSAMICSSGTVDRRDFRRGLNLYPV